jgi:acyl-CoA synthetase (AMP-forming)/AMP-acid ligase II
VIKAGTLVEMMGQRAAADPEKAYFTLFDTPVAYGQLWRESERYAAGLRRFGIERGDKVCLIYPTCAEFFYTFFGALRLGAVPVPLYPTLGVEATASIFRDSEAKAVATIGWFRSGVEESQAAAPNIRHVLEPSDLEVAGPAPAFPTAATDDVAFIQYTSGSTGQPRGVVLTHANVVRTVEFMAEAAQLTRDDVVVSWLPLYHDMGLIGCSFTPPWSGAPLHLLPPDLKNPRVWLELVTRVGATFTVSPDFGYRNCVRNIHDTSGLDLSSLKQALSGAEPVRLSTIEAFERKFDAQNLITPCYGLAEATLAVAIWPRRTPLRLDSSGRFLSVGKPCRGVRVRIMDGEEEVKPGVEAEICVSSPGVMQGYYNNPEATRKILSPDGWLRTGDLGFVDAEGFLYVTGRPIWRRRRCPRSGRTRRSARWPRSPARWTRALAPRSRRPPWWRCRRAGCASAARGASWRPSRGRTRTWCCRACRPWWSATRTSSRSRRTPSNGSSRCRSAR